MRCLVALSILLLLTAGCKPVGPIYQQPSMQAPTAWQEGWKQAQPADAAPRADWWSMLGDSELNRLEALVDTANPSLQAAAENYAAAHAAFAAARSSLYPTLGLAGSASRQSASRNGTSYSSSRPGAYNDLTLSGQASWEPDFFGRIHSTIAASAAGAQASAADLATLRLSLHAELAADYFALRSVDAQSALLRTTVDDLTQQLKLNEQRLQAGLSSAVDVAQAQTQLETVRAQLVDLEATRAPLVHALAVLSGQAPSALQLDAHPLSLTAELPAVPSVLPAELLERRPDVASAERRIAQANAQIGVARAALYPHLTLGLTGGLESMQPTTLFQGPATLWSLGAQATQFLFDAGQRRALTEEARHNYEAQAANYRATVLAAFRDVEDQLAALRVLNEESHSQSAAVASARESLKLSRKRYEGGVTSYLEVLTAEQTLLAAQRVEVDLASRRWQATISLLRASGGGWSRAQLPPA